jgi:serine/threonine protein kinase
LGCLTSEQFDLLRRAAAPSTDLAAWWGHIDSCDACARRIIEGTRRFGVQPAAAMGPDDSTSARHPEIGAPGSANVTTARTAAPAEPLPSVPGFELLRELHRGGQGVVYLALQKSTKREVAIKVMLQGPFAGPGDRARFEREVAILARLEHPNIVTIHDSGVASGAHYFVMRYVAGVALDTWIKSNAGDRDRVLRLFVEICDAVEAAHARGVVHRDLKPGNIRVGPDDRPAVLDFGLAKVAGGGGLEALAMTQTGQFMGSVPWASPEQAAGESSRLSPRSDVYALGVMLFQALTGEFPYSIEGNVREVLDRVRFADALRPSSVVRRLSTSRASAHAPIDRELDTIVLTCLRKEPERRYASAGALAADLRRYLAGESIVARSDSLAYVVASRSRRLVRRNPLVASLAGIAIATALALLVGIPLAYRWTPAQRWFERVAFAIMPPLRAGGLEHVAVIDFHKNIEFGALAQTVGVAPPADPNERRWLRAVHGALLERLAAAKPGVVAWNISFVGASPYDEAFVRGVERLGAPVLVALPSWADKGAALLSPSIAAVTEQGCEPSGFSPHGWRAFVAIVRDDSEPLRSLALQAFVLSRRPRDASSEVRVDARDDMVEVRYWSHPVAAERRRSLDVQKIRVTAIRPPGPETAGRNGILPTDEIAHFALRLPSEARLTEATVAYDAVFTMPDDELRRRFEGKIVLVGSSRDPTVHLPAPSGSSLWATYGQAVAIEQLRNGAGVVMPAHWEGRLATAAIATLGLLAGRRRPRGLLLRGSLYTGLGVACAAACVAALWLFGYLYSPIVALFALAGGLGFGELIHSARARGVGGSVSSGSSGVSEART